MKIKKIKKKKNKKRAKMAVPNMSQAGMQSLAELEVEMMTDMYNR